MSKPVALIGRRNLTAALGVGGLVLAAPGIARAQTREIVIGGAASHKPWFEAHVQAEFERKYRCRLTFEGTRSLVNLEKMQKNKDKPYISVVQMDDPVMILAVREGLLEPITGYRLQLQCTAYSAGFLVRHVRKPLPQPYYCAIAAEHRRPAQLVHDGPSDVWQANGRGLQGY